MANARHLTMVAQGSEQCTTIMATILLILEFGQRHFGIQRRTKVRGNHGLGFNRPISHGGQVRCPMTNAERCPTLFRPGDVGGELLDSLRLLRCHRLLPEHSRGHQRLHNEREACSCHQLDGWRSSGPAPWAVWDPGADASGVGATTPNHRPAAHCRTTQPAPRSRRCDIR